MSEPDSEAWLARYVAALEAHSGITLPSGLTTARAARALLTIARDVAHGTERKNAPLATGVVGSYVTLRVAQGVTAEVALREASEVLVSLLP